MKVVINTIYGGFGLSDQAMKLFLEKKKIKYTVDPRPSGDSFFYTQPTTSSEVENQMIWEGDINRDDPILVQVVEELKDRANGQHANLKVVEIPDDIEWYVEEYDGAEHVAEVHRTWS
jgi:hypothetical protein